MQVVSRVNKKAETMSDSWGNFEFIGKYVRPNTRRCWLVGSISVLYRWCILHIPGPAIRYRQTKKHKLVIVCAISAVRFAALAVLAVMFVQLLQFFRVVCFFGRSFLYTIGALYHHYSIVR